jgi:hypothetical protein
MAPPLKVEPVNAEPPRPAAPAPKPTPSSDRSAAGAGAESTPAPKLETPEKPGVSGRRHG